MKFSLLCIGLFAAIALSTDPRSCRCLPDQPCWPTESQWSALNSSIAGNLVAVKPLARPCHDPNFNATECDVVKANTYNATYRSSHPGALQWTNWETWPASDEKCYTESPQSEPCNQGRLSLLSAEVQTAQHIQKVVNFASRHNIKLVIKNTGHDFLGRSSSPKSLQILTHFMKNMSISNEFVPTVPPTSSPPAASGLKTVTVGAGVQLGEMYAFLGARGLMAVGGTFSTVGMAGGYIQGGGHSFLGWMHGMASDNVLEFQVVLADGSFVFANEYQNSDLFFALRGGGGGSFGVVVSATLKVYPDYPLIYATLNYTTDPDPTFWAGVSAFQKHIIRLNDEGGSGYYGMVPITPISDTENASAFLSSMAFVNQTDKTTIENLFAPLVSDLEQAIGFKPSVKMIKFPSMSSMYSQILSNVDTTGTGMRLGSRLISRDFIKSDTSPSTRLTKAMSSLSYAPGEGIAGVILSGGQVSKNRNITSALNPAWRETMIHVIFTRILSPGMTLDEQESIASNITRNEVPIFKELEPGKMGAYVNEADGDEVGFQESFWGENYERLRGIKARRDPGDLFIVRRGVGSEFWDGDGFCRVEHSVD